MSSEVADNVDRGLGSEVVDQVVEGGSFVSLAAFSTANFTLSVVGGHVLADRFGVDQSAAALMTAPVTTAVEFPLTSLAKRRFNSDLESGAITETESRFRNAGKIIKNVLSVGYASAMGATTSPKIDNSLGIESTRNRRLVQSAAWGTAAGLWVSPLPGFSDLAEGSKSLLREVAENPVEGSAATVGTAAIVYGLAEGFKRGKNRFSNWREGRRQENPVAEAG